MTTTMTYGRVREEARSLDGRPLPGRTMTFAFARAGDLAEFVTRCEDAGFRARVLSNEEVRVERRGGEGGEEGR